MKIKIFIIVALLLFSYQFCNAQPKMNISVGGGYVFTPNVSGKLSYWRNGYLINISLDYLLNNSVLFSFYTSYQNDYFDANLVQLVTPTFLGERFEYNGENSKLYDIDIRVKIYVSQLFIKPFLTFGSGIIIINQGKVTSTSWRENNGGEKSSKVIPSSGKNYTIGQFIVGSGLEIQLNNDLELLIEGNILSSISNGIICVPISTSIKIGL